MKLTLDQLLEKPIQTRFAMAFDDYARSHVRVYLAGCGAIGSRLAVELAKMGVNWFHLHDMDHVEPANIGVQMFHYGHLGDHKVTATADLIEQNSSPMDPPRIQKSFKPITTQSYLPTAATVIISAVDRMSVRRWLWRKWKRQSENAPRQMVYIDPRMGFDTYEVYTSVDKTDNRYTRHADINYERTLKFDAPPANCGAQASPYTASACAATVAGIIKAWATQEQLYNWYYHNVGAMHTQRGFLLNGITPKIRRRRRLCQPTE